MECGFGFIRKAGLNSLKRRIQNSLEGGFDHTWREVRFHLEGGFNLTWNPGLTCLEGGFKPTFNLGSISLGMWVRCHFEGGFDLTGKAGFNSLGRRVRSYWKGGSISLGIETHSFASIIHFLPELNKMKMWILLTITRIHNNSEWWKFGFMNTSFGPNVANPH